ncbi:MAG: helix-turn-helix transcriptional regulator [Candidatus Scatosoma sp.]
MDTKFCRNLKSARKSCNLTQKQVAIRLNVVESCYANWEQGRTEPSIEMLRKLGVVLSVDVNDLINGDL